MSDNPNEITIDNSVLVLIDHQPWVAFEVKSIDAALLVNNLQGLAASAKALDVPTILTTVGAEGGILKDPLIKGLADAGPDVTPIDRVSTNAWEDIRGAVEATGRRTLLIAGLWTEVCLAQTSVSAIADGYRVFFISDCSGGMSVASCRAGNGGHAGVLEGLSRSWPIGRAIGGQSGSANTLSASCRAVSLRQ